MRTKHPNIFLDDLIKEGSLIKVEESVLPVGHNFMEVEEEQVGEDPETADKLVEVEGM